MSEETESIPKDLVLSETVQDIDLHPFKDIIVAGTLEGPVKIYSYGANKSKPHHKLMSFPYHKESCRAVKFSSHGDFLFTASTDKRVLAIDLNEGTLSRKMTYDELDAVYSLLPIDNYLLASGDDNGLVIIWDFRRQMPLMTIKCSVDYISKFAVSSDKRTLIASSGDGSFSVFNIRARKMEAQSGLLDHEVMSVAIVENESKVVAGLNSGTLKFYNWGDWDNCIDKFSVYTGAMDDIVAFDDKTICAGCEDGNIRVVGVNPNRIITLLGNSYDVPVCNVCVSHDKKVLASCAYEDVIKFHSLSPLKDAKESDNNKSGTVMPNSYSFFSDLET